MFHDLFLIPITSLLLVAAPAPELCKTTPQFEVFPVFPHVASDNSLESVNLFSDDAWGMLKLEHLDLKNILSFQAEYVRHIEKGVACQSMAKVTVVYRIDATLRMKNPYPVDSCEYNQIKTHAESHVEAARNFQKQNLPVLETFLSESFAGKGGVVENGREEEIRDELQRAFSIELFSYAKYLNNEFDRLQNKTLDSPDEMKKIFAACPNRQEPIDP